MGALSQLSKVLIIAGLVLIVIGIFVNFGLGRLPGDIYIKKDTFSFYFPVTSCVLVSVIVTLFLLIIKQ